MPDECAGKKCRSHLWNGCVPVAPKATIECVHEFGFARENSNRHATADNLSIGCKIGLDIEERLYPARMHAEPRYHLVEHQRRFRRFCYGSKLTQKISRL